MRLNSPIIQHLWVSEKLDLLKQTVGQGGSLRLTARCLSSEDSAQQVEQPLLWSVGGSSEHMPAPEPQLFQIVWIPPRCRQAFCVSI